MLDTPPDAELDALVELVARVCDVPFALISLVAKDRQYFKSALGLDETGTSREISFCAHAIMGRDTMVVPDAEVDPRFRDNPLVTGGPKVRFYAGAPLTTDAGMNLGTLCVLDQRPRQLSDDQLQTLRLMARQVMKHLDLRRELVEKKALAQALDDALQARERVLSVVSHDLRTPLSTVSITADHLEEVTSDERVQRASRRLRRAVRSMGRLVDDLLDFESMNKGRMSMRHRPVPLTEILEAVHGAHELAAAEREVALVVDAVDDVVIACDPGRVQQALGNVVRNALAVCSKGGTVRLRATDEGASVSISVIDDGPGFEEAVADRLFEPFWRGSSSHQGGVGLGLAIANTIAQAHGGSLAAVSEPGNGACFTLTLPRRGQGAR